MRLACRTDEERALGQRSITNRSSRSLPEVPGPLALDSLYGW